MWKKFSYLTAAAAFCTLLLGLGFAYSNGGQGENASGIRWYSFNEGVEKIKKSDKKGFLHFYTEWCGYCRKMKKETFSDKEVISSLNKDFVSIKINAEDQPGVARKFGVNRFPFNWFVDKKNEPIGNQPGFIPPEMMVHILEYMTTNDYKNMGFDEFMEERE